MGGVLGEAGDGGGCRSEDNSDAGGGDVIW